ncbi:MAG: SusC/RagA family TonB-linked outer membrane protein [Draconibacterium sp.]|nr:SusC/RagA family TonB-linked outer membrane protein [Draconibacterium sp.]
MKKNQFFYGCDFHFLMKTFKIMRITVFLLLASVLQIFANGAYSQKTTLSLDFSNTKLVDVMDEIEEQTEFYFLFNEKLINTDRKVSMSVKNKKISEILNKLFSGTDVDYTITDRKIILAPEYLSGDGQQKSITGTVTNEAGETLPGVTIFIKGSTQGTVTNMDGEYTISNVPENATLHFSFVGMLAQEIIVGSQSTINVILANDYIGIEEVITIGYGTVRKSDLTGSVSSVNVESMKDRPIISADQLLQGSVAGVNMTLNSGAPGAGSSINIRGVSTINGSSQPLIVIDGMPMEDENNFVALDDGGSEQPALNPLAMMNPNDIASIEVLKDASSTAIYGSRGANGVILITTKKGKRGGKINYNFRTDIANFPAERKIDMLGTREYLEYLNIGLEEGGLPVTPQVEIDSIVNSAGNVDWQDEIYRTGITQDHQLSISGADDKTNYSVMVGYSDVEGIIINSYLKRYSIRNNFSRKVTDWLSVNTNFSYNRTISNQVQHSASFGSPSTSVVLAAMMQAPLYKTGDEYEDEEDTFSDNPITIATKVDNHYDVQSLLGRFGVDIDLFKGLTYKGSVNFNSYRSLRQSYKPRGTGAGDGAGGVASLGEADNFTYVLENLLNYDNTITEGHRLNAVLGFTYRNSMLNQLKHESSGFLNDNLTYNYPQGATVNGKVYKTKVETELASFLTRVNYSINNKYSFTFTGRYDGSSRLEQKWSFFPSGAAAWRVSNEEFMNDIKELSNFKIRASYGYSGRQAVRPLAGKTLLATATGISGEAWTTALLGNSQGAAGTLGNPNLKWERTGQIDIGFDLGMFDNKVRVTFDWFKKNTTDLLLALPIAWSNSYEQYWTNLGEIENTGIEFEIGANIINNTFRWDVSGNYSTANNKVLDLGELDMLLGEKWMHAGGIRLNQPVHTAKVGHEIGAFFGYKTDGIYQNDAEVAAGPEPDAVPGDLKFVDIAGGFDDDGNSIPDGKITPEDQTIIGSASPDFIFGFTNNFSYKNFALSLFFQGSIGNEVLNLNRYITDALATGINRNIRQEVWDNRWQGEGTSNTFGRVRSDALLFNTRASDFLVEDASYVRLKNITFSYNIPLKTNKFISNARIYVTGSNIFVFTNYSGYDPEVSAKNKALEPGVDFGVFPQPRVFSIGANIEF